MRRARTCSRRSRPMSALPTLWFEQPAARWLAALPVGNGRLGATVFGRVYKETIIFNEESVWTRWPDDRNNPDALTRAARGASTPAGRRGRAGAHARRALDVRDAAPSGELPGARRHDAAVRRPPRGARHRLPALARPRRRHRRGRVRARRRPLPARGLRQRPGRRRRAPVRGRRGTGAVELGSHYYRRYDAFERIEGTRPRRRRGRRRARAGIHTRARVARRGRRPSSRSATTSPSAERTRSRSSSARRRTSATTTRRRRAVDALDAAASRSYAELRARHVESHRPPMRRVRLRLGGPAGPRPRRHCRRTCASNASRQAALDPGLVELHFQFGRYLLLGSSRRGRCPRTSRGSGTTATSPPGTASSRSTSTCR